MGSRRRFRVNGTATGPAPYSQGWRAPWRGEWGPLGDPHSKLGRLAKHRAHQELEKLGVTAPTALQAAQAREVGDLLAIRDMVKAGIGVDPKCTVRRLTAVAKTAEAERRALRSLVARAGRPDPLAAVHRAVAEANR